MPFIPNAAGMTDAELIAAQTSVILGQGGLLRIRWRPDLTDDYSESDNTNYNIALVPYEAYEYSFDPENVRVTESDSPGHQHPGTVPMIMIHVDLRARVDPMSLEALLLMDDFSSSLFIDEVFIDKGNTLTGRLIQQMNSGPFQRRGQAVQPIKDAFTLLGGYVVQENVALPDRFNPDA